jgi:hypothetical protein
VEEIAGLEDFSGPAAEKTDGLLFTGALGGNDDGDGGRGGGSAVEDFTQVEVGQAGGGSEDEIEGPGTEGVVEGLAIGGKVKVKRESGMAGGSTDRVRRQAGAGEEQHAGD